MPSLLSRLVGLFPGFRGRPTAATISPDPSPSPLGSPSAAPGALLPADPALTPDGRLAIIKAAKQQLDNTPARPRPSSDERIPRNSGFIDKIWFLPYQDSVTRDTPEIRAAMRLMRRDGYVKAAWEPQILTVASEDWQVQAAEPGNDESEEQADFCKRVVEDYLDGAMTAGVRAVCAPFGSDGFSLAEPVWSVADRGKLQNKIVLASLKARDCDQNTVRIEGDRYGNVRGIQSLRDTEQRIWPIDEFVYSRYLTVFDEPLGEAAFRPAYGPYWMRDTVRKLRAIHHEKRMAGTLLGTYRDNDDKAPLESALRAAKTSTWLSIPEGCRVEALALSTASEPDYRSFDESLRDEIVQAIAFATLQIIQGNVPDARGDSKVQKSMADLGPWLLMVLVQVAFNRHIFPKLIDFNYAFPAGGGYPKLTFGAVSNQELLELLQVVTGAQQAGFNPSRKHYAKALSIQEADPNDPSDSLSPQGGGMGVGGLGGGMVGGLGGGMPPGGGDPFGGMGGDPTQPPPDQQPPGGQIQAFSDRVHYEFRDPVKWERQGNGTWKSSGGRVLSDAAYQRHKSRLDARKQKGNTRPVAPNSQPQAGVSTAPPPEANPHGPDEVPNPPASGSIPAMQPGGLRKGTTVDHGVGGEWTVNPDGTWKGPAVPEGNAGRGTLAKAKSGAAAVARGAAKGAKAAARGAKRVASNAVKLQNYIVSSLQQASAWGLQKSAEAAGWIGTQLKNWSWLERNTGIGRAIEKDAGRKARRFAAIKAAAATGKPLSAAKAAILTAADLAFARARQTRRKHGRGAAWATEGLYFVLSVLGRAKRMLLSVPGLGMVLRPVSLFLGTLLNPLVRKASDRAAILIGGRTGHLGPKARNPDAPGRVAMAIERAEKLPEKKIAKRIAKGRSSVKWLAKKRELEAADREGRDPNLTPDEVKILRRAAAISAGQHSEVFADVNPDAAPTDPTELALDLRRMLEDDTGEELPLSDGQLSALVAYALAEVNRIVGDAAEQHETFAEQRYEVFAWQAARTRSGSIKAVGTAEDQGKTLYGRKAEAALRSRGGTTGSSPAPADGAAGGDMRVQVGSLAGVRPGRSMPTRPGKELTDVRQVKNARTRAEGPTQEHIDALAQRTAAGESAAATELQTHAANTLQQAATELAKAPVEPAKIRAAYRAAQGRTGATAGSREGTKFKLFGRAEVAVENFLSAVVGEPDPQGIAGKVGSLVNHLTGLGGKALWWGVRSLAKFARFALTNAGRGAWAATKGVARGAWAVAKSDTVRPFLRWAGVTAGAAAMLAAPVLAVKFGLIHWFFGFLAAPVAVAGTGMFVNRQRMKAVAPPPFAQHSEAFAEGADLAPAGPDGRKADELLASVRGDVVRLFREKCQSAVARLMKSGNPLAAPVLFDDQELGEIAAGLGRVVATSDLLGRAGVRRRAEMADGGKFAEGADHCYHDFAEPVPVLSPQKAIDYVRSRVGSLAGDTGRYGPKLDRHATTLAIAADEVLLNKVKEAVVKELEGGGDATPDIDRILDEAGVGKRNQQYGEMIARTNAVQALTEGAAAELATPEMRESFPAWRYLGVLDSRTGDDHRPKIGKYYPSSANFADVRGPRIWNCVLPGHYVQARALRGLKARYAGEVIEIHSAGGYRLTVTPNHPVLTGGGFVAAHELVKGQHLLSYRGESKIAAFNEHNENPPSLIENVFESLAVLFGRPRVAPVTALDLHGDAIGSQGEIDVVGADISLMLNGEPASLKRGGQSGFAGGNLALFEKPSGSSPGLHFGRVLHSSPSLVGRGDLPPSTLGGVGLSPFRVGPGAELDTRRGQQLHDGWATNAEFPRELLGSGGGKVFLDEIVQVNRREFSGHVYDLETDVGYYVAGCNITGGIIVSNCRCNLQPVHKSMMDGVKVEDSW